MGKNYIATVQNSARNASTLEKLRALYAAVSEAGYGDQIKDLVEKRAKELKK